MEFFSRVTKFNFMGWRHSALVLSTVLNIAVVALLVTGSGLNLGIDFTGGTLVEVNYAEPAEIAQVRDALARQGLERASVQHFGATRDVLVRLQIEAGKTSAEQSELVLQALRAPLGEHRMEQTRVGGAQQCTSAATTTPFDCKVQMRRVEFVGPQVGGELVDKGLLALLYAMIGISIYVAFRFEWRFAVGAVVATLHDILLTMGFFGISGIEFSLVSLAAVLTVMGYSLNDTVVVFDRIRENFRKLRKNTSIEIMNISINETLSRTVMTGVTALMVVGTLFFLGGDTLHGFSAALIIGILIGTYSSIFIASPAVLLLGLERSHLVPAKKEGAAEDRP